MKTTTHFARYYYAVSIAVFKYFHIIEQ